MKVLDVACGSGNLAVVGRAKRCGSYGPRSGRKPRRSGRKRAEAAGLKIKFDQGDAENLPYDDNSFDLVMTMYGAMSLPGRKSSRRNWSASANPAGASRWRIGRRKVSRGRCSSCQVNISRRRICRRQCNGACRKSLSSVSATGSRTFRMNKRLADMVFEYGPAEVVDHFRNYFGPTVMAFKAIPPEHHDDFRQDLENIWTQNNTASDGTTHVKGEYLEVIAEKK